jgi:sigma-B regulation protein RsbU (phosphoserine phosphatase)
MIHKSKSRYLWFKASIVFGLLLGLVLLVQTVATYHYVSGNLIRQEAQREAERKALVLEKSARAAQARNAAHLVPILDELRREAPRQIAWVRVINPENQVLAASGEPISRQFSSISVRQALEKHEAISERRETPAGRVLVTIQPFITGHPPLAGPHSLPPVVELAIYLDGVSVPFGLLRQHLIVGCLAAMALVASMIIIGLRFGHYMRGKQLEQQLDLARRVQSDLLPSGSPVCHGLDFAADCIQASQVGGDFYDVFEVEKGQAALVLGDVSGKGLSAALLMGVIHGALRSSCWAGSASDHEESLSRLNQLLCAKTANERFATLFSCYFDPQSGVLRYVNAGHPPPLLVRQGHRGRLEVEHLHKGGPVLGVLPSALYTQSDVNIEPGDLLVMFSDGILEAQNEHDEEFGEDGVLQVICRNRDKSPGEICDSILASVREFLGREAVHDDQTLLVVRLEPISQRRPLHSYEAVAC